ncbi:interferon-induced protein 44-like [Sceloporus undulatus]|uniref:interferon-induced protein 44-like n=1 Tax=Sceloporus undulatus TaxID=8520 RepID=UPI001C4D6701|nr:interferon-induced protein 44-like [Sceloporus undulatus]XP_042320168.1 interferon-induced protein 44-like [Sceloporus undulatus]
MADIKSRLTKEEKKGLLHLLGNKDLCLLYKGSVHGYTANVFHGICNRQGPTVVVAYNSSGYIFGGFTVHSYASSGAYLNDEKAFLFKLKGKDGKLCPLKIPVKDASKAIYDHSGYGPYFGGGSLIFLSQNSAAVATNVNAGSYVFGAEDLHGNDQVLLECEVFRVEDVGEMMEKPWRTVIWAAEERRKLMNQIAAFKPHLNSVPQFRVLFLGPVGAGKSSFFNSVKSIFRGYVTSQAIAGSDSTSVTMQYRTYQIKNEGNGKPLPIIFCDTMGLEERQGVGLAIDEVPNLLQGHVPDRYQFNPSAAMQRNSLGYVKCPSLKDQVHCVVFVIDGSKIEILPDNLGEKLREIRRKSNKFGVPQLVILTKVDEICPSLEENVSDVYRSRTVEKQMQLTAERLGLPLCQIVPVKNYSSELDLKDNVDILILMAVRQMLRLAESYLDDFPLEKNSTVDIYSDS